jgi:hypothetical protein
LAACASAPPIAPDLRRRASAVVLVDGPPPPGFQAIAQVQGIDCQKNLYGGEPSFTAAREQLRLEAARRGATAVASILCQKEAVSWGDNCWKSVRCLGDAGTVASPARAPQPEPGVSATSI